jgi:hypothetical protein
MPAQAENYAMNKGTCGTGTDIYFESTGISGIGFQCQFTGPVFSAGSGLGLDPSECYINSRQVVGRTQISLVRGTDDLLLELPDGIIYYMYVCN